MRYKTEKLVIRSVVV